MSIEIDVLNGDASWPLAEPLLEAVWPRRKSWQSCPGATSYSPMPTCGCWSTRRGSGRPLVCHVGIYRRDVTWNGRKVRIGGIGGVATREDCRGRGYASIALDAAIQTLSDQKARSISRCCSASRTTRRSTRRAAGTRSTGEIYAEQPAGPHPLRRDGAVRVRITRAPRKGTIDLCGLPW